MKINLAIGELHSRKHPPEMYPPQRRQEDCTYLKKKQGDEKGWMVCLKEYDETDIHLDDLKIIKRHVLRQTEDGTSYYDFTNERTLEEVKAEKMRLLKEGKWVFDKDTVFSEGKRTEFIPAHYETYTVYWDCDNDDWKEETT